MPSKPLRPCASPGCPELVASGRCEKHSKQEQQRYDKRRGNFRERGYTSQWDKVRLIKLRRNPLCERCDGQGKVESATLVHHIQSLSKGGALTDMSNLMSLCIKCHDDIHMEQGDKW
jgi:5-methylcytosine-specific restriction protein A